MFSLGVLALHLTIGRTEACVKAYRRLLAACLTSLSSMGPSEARIRLSEMERTGAGKDLKAVEVRGTGPGRLMGIFLNMLKPA